jgi:hypothetical protein
MDPNDPTVSQKSNPPVVSLPVSLYHQMALCFYGEGPRHWELFAPGARAHNLSPHPPAEPMGLGGVTVPTIPPTWRRVRDEPSEVPTPEGQ